MGNSKNSQNKHTCRGKYKKRVPPWCTDTQQKEITTPATSLDGNRIVSLTQLVSFITDVSTHSKSCEQGTVSLHSESKRDGMASTLCIFTAKCDTCNEEIQFLTSGKVSGVSNSQRWETNVAATWKQCELLLPIDTQRYMCRLSQWWVCEYVQA